MKSNFLRYSAAALSVLIFAPTSAQATDPMEGLDKGKVMVDVRYRYENVDQDGIANEADAHTLRARFGAVTGYYYYLRGGVEVEGVTNLEDDEEFNNTINGKTQFPVVADVEVAEINQAFVDFIGIPKTTIRGGRSVEVLGNQRYFGHVGWRQNNQSFDGVFVKSNLIPETKLWYNYVGNVNRLFGNDSPIGDAEANTHLFQLENKSLPIGTVGAYAYFMDFEETITQLSNQSFGGYIKGKKKLRDDFGVHWYFEYAHQSDYADKAISYDADYYHIAPGFTWKGIKTTIGYEVLGSDDGVQGFVTPLATLHKFNGWADKFLATPANGLEDFYVDVTYKFKGLEGPLKYLNGTLVKGQYHKFESNEGDIDYGEEFGFFTKTPLGKGFYMHSKYANYQADNFATDTEKYIFGLGFKY